MRIHGARLFRIVLSLAAFAVVTSGCAGRVVVTPSDAPAAAATVLATRAAAHQTALVAPQPLVLDTPTQAILETATPEPASEPAPVTMPPAVVTIEHTVSTGDTLIGIAFEYGVPMAAIQLANDLGSETGLLAGQVLDIPPASDWASASPFWVLALVEEGDTLSGIAARYGLTLADLQAANRLGDADILRIGQPLVLPLAAPAEVVRAVPPTHTPPPTVAPEPTVAVAMDTEEAAAAVDILPAEPTVTPPAPPPPSGEVADWPMEVYRLINAVRAEHGVPPYGYNEVLAHAAALHGADCQQRGYCNHTGSDGSNVRARVQRAGYAAAGAAECIVYSKTPQQAVAWWMDEAPPNDAHRRTLLSTWVTEIGIAVVPIGNGSYYFIADFGRPGGS